MNVSNFMNLWLRLDVLDLRLLLNVLHLRLLLNVLHLLLEINWKVTVKSYFFNTNRESLIPEVERKLEVELR